MNMVFMLRIILIIVIFVIIVYVIRISSAQKKAKRISNYAIDPVKSDYYSYSDRILNSYYKFVKRMRPLINKSFYLKKSAKKYEKYISYDKHGIIEGYDFIITKFVIAIIFVVFTAFSQVFSSRVLGIFDFVINYFIGYFILDVYLHFIYKRKQKQMATDLLRAVIVMNNAFKSGKSTLQAIKIASDELDGPLKDEFRKMYLDMKYGLSVDTVFERFARRVKLQEAVYVSSSLTVLNKTGGNIVEVFSSIERTLFDKKKLKEEMKNISSAPKIVVIILSIVPVLFIGVVYLLNPTYFNPLFSSTLGYIIIAIIVIMFIIYLVTLLRTLKVDE